MMPIDMQQTVVMEPVPCNSDCPGPLGPDYGMMGFSLFHDRNHDGAPNEDEPAASGYEVRAINDNSVTILRSSENGFCSFRARRGVQYSVRWDGQEWAIDMPMTGDIVIFLGVNGTPVTVLLPDIRG
jgi:hypothetical protein